MNILFDSMGTQVQVQGATGGRLNTFFGALADAGYSLRYRNYHLPMSRQLDPVDLFIVLTHLWDSPPGWPPVIPPDTDFTWSDDDLDSIQAWVKNGGSLLLISSHTVFTPNDIPLAARFGIKIVPAMFVNGETLTMMPTASWPGLSASVSSVQAWDSCGITGVSGDVDVILPFPAGTYDAYARYDASRYAFAVAATYGEGDVVVAGHSGIVGDYGSPFPSQGQIDAGDTRQFLLNCVSYLGADGQP